MSLCLRRKKFSRRNIYFAGSRARSSQSGRRIGIGTSAASKRHPDRAARVERQREVLQLVAEGKSNKEVASTMNLTVKTIEFHKARISKELGAHSTAGGPQNTPSPLVSFPHLIGLQFHPLGKRSEISSSSVGVLADRLLTNLLCLGFRLFRAAFGSLSPWLSFFLSLVPRLLTIITSVRPEGLPEEVNRQAALPSATTVCTPQRRTRRKCWTTFAPTARRLLGLGRNGYHSAQRLALLFGRQTSLAPAP